MENSEIDGYIETLAHLIESREHYQMVMGEMAVEVSSVWGLKGLDMLANTLKERHGKTISPHTLRNYGWVWEKTHDLDLPEDATFRTRRAIASVDNPQKYVDMYKHGHTNAEIYRAIKGKPKERVVTCKKCKHTFQI